MRMEAGNPSRLSRNGGGMTKARTISQKRAQRRKARPEVITLAGGETAHQRPSQGQRQRKEPADMVAMQARIRQTGLTQEQARHEMAGCAVGRKLMLDHIEDRAALWEAVKHMRRVIVAYDRSVGAPSRHAQGLRIMLPTERMEADASSPTPDLREPEERARAAQAAWMALKGWLSHADYAAREACTRAVVDEPDEPISDWTGVVLALRCVSEGIKGQRIKLRARKA